MCIGLLPAWMSVYHLYAVPMEAGEGIRTPETGVTNGCEPLYGCWEPNIEDQPVLLMTESSLQSQNINVLDATLNLDYILRTRDEHSWKKIPVNMGISSIWHLS